MSVKNLFAATVFAMAGLAAAMPLAAQERLTLDALKAADYMKGKQAFQGRCSACHTLGDDSGDIAGPNLWGVFDRVIGSKPGFRYSDTLAGLARCLARRPARLPAR